MGWAPWSKLTQEDARLCGDPLALSPRTLALWGLVGPATAAAAEQEGSKRRARRPAVPTRDTMILLERERERGPCCPLPTPAHPHGRPALHGAHPHDQLQLFPCGQQHQDIPALRGHCAVPGLGCRQDGAASVVPCRRGPVKGSPGRGGPRKPAHFRPTPPPATAGAHGTPDSPSCRLPEDRCLGELPAGEGWGERQLGPSPPCAGTWSTAGTVWDQAG